MSPSAFIPFCSFGNKFLGLINDKFPFPLCNNFKPRLLNSNLCYEIDVNEYKDSFTLNNLKEGLIIFVDNNEDRQYSWMKPKKNSENFLIYLETLGSGYFHSR